MEAKGAGLAEATRRVGEIVRALAAEIERRWPQGVIPAAEGGCFFRAMADRHHCTEALLADLAMTLGCWPWSVIDVMAAFGAGPDPEDEAEEEDAEAVGEMDFDDWLELAGWREGWEGV
jgi:hypothetical protein